MKWFLIGYVSFSGGGDPGIMPGYVASFREVRIEMPSQEVCEQIKTLNKFSTFECWAKRELEK